MYVCSLCRRCGNGDVVCCSRSHGLGGILGMIMTGFFADVRVNAFGANGVFYERGELLRLQVVTIVTVVPLVFVVSYLLCILTNFVVPMRVDADVEKVGLDTSQHGESILIRPGTADSGGTPHMLDPF